MSKDDKTEILVDTFGNKAPDAAKFGVGTRTNEGAQQAQDARRNVRGQAINQSLLLLAGVCWTKAKCDNALFKEPKARKRATTLVARSANPSRNSPIRVMLVIPVVIPMNVVLAVRVVMPMIAV